MTQIFVGKQDIRIYMLHIAGQTAGPIGLKFCVDTHFKKKKFPRATPSPSASIYYNNQINNEVQYVATAHTLSTAVRCQISFLC